MRIGCLQFAPQVGDINNNLNRADAVLNRADPGDLDVLVLPELAFTGYNFKSLRDISPYLEPTGSGVTALWARTTALKYDCTVITGYPEKVDVSTQWPANPEYYNSSIVVNGDGETLANYRKSHLYYTDETWALEGPDGFYADRIPGLGRAAMGICMDINPYRFESPWDKFEFAHHALDFGAHLIIIPMAWLTHENPREYSRMPQEPDMQTLMYWISRLEPIVRLESAREVIVIFANRTGTEDEVTYAGTSTVVGIKDGEVLVYGILGRGDKELLVVDTDEPPFARLVQTAQTPADAASVDDSQVANDNGSTSERSSTRHRSDGVTRGSPGTPSSSGRTGSSRSDKQSDKQSSRAATVDMNESLGRYNSKSNDRDRLDPRTPISTSTDDIDVLKLYLDEQPSRTPSSNGYLNSNLGYTHEQRLSTAKTPDSIRARQGSVSDSDNRPLKSSALSQRPVRSATREGENGQTSRKRNVSDHRRDEGTDIILSEDEWHSENEASWGGENRRSFHSDVSVWNNFSGRSQPPEAPSSPRSRMISQKVEDYLRGSTPKSESQQDISRFTDPASHKKSESKSRLQTSSRAEDRRTVDSKAAERQKSGLGHKSSGSRAGSAKASARAPASRAVADSPLQRRDSRAKATPMTSNSPAVRTSISRMSDADSRVASIPIAMDRETWGAARQASTSRQRPPVQAENELPILRPASKARIREGSEPTRGRAAGSPPTKATDSTPPHAGEAITGNQETRGLSRGRQRMTRSALDQYQDLQPRQGVPRVSQSAQNTRRTPSATIDLSQFHLIEEVPSANCPVHGSRSQSASRRHTGTENIVRRRSSAGGHGRPARPGSRDIRESRRRSTQNTPAQPIRGLVSGPVSGSVSGPVSRPPSDQASPPVSPPPRPLGSAPRIRPSKDALQSARRMTQSVQIGVREIGRNGKVNTGSDIVTTELTRLDLKQGPKTPVAMVLIGGGNGQVDVAEASQSSFFAIKGTNIEPGRPRSAVW